MRFPGSIDSLTLYVQVNRHFVAAVRVRRDAKISAAVLATGAHKFQRANTTIRGVLFLQCVPIVSEFLLQVRARLFPQYLQRVITLRLAAQRCART